MEDCIFCKIANGEIPTDFVYQDSEVAVFRDVNPQAPTHLLVIPKRHITSSAEVSDSSVWNVLWSSIQGLRAVRRYPISTFIFWRGVTLVGLRVS